MDLPYISGDFGGYGTKLRDATSILRQLISDVE